MWQRNVRLRNKILQVLYRPRIVKSSVFSSQSLSIFDELDKAIEEKITPIFSELFE
ncbi:MAG: hypothetical protein FWF78_03940 [Defluviitaleaceae bacterium]|nr:hypothetical protein [Defluviitaleaceae bacterium]